MEPFIRTDQFQLIKKQTKNIAHAKLSVNDSSVMEAVKSLAWEKVIEAIGSLSNEQKIILEKMKEVQDRESADLYSQGLKPYVIPFQPPSEKGVQKLFPKAKKLKSPDFRSMDLKQTTYISWIDKGSSKKFIIAPYEGEMIGLQGSFRPLNQKGICAICNGNEEVGLFVCEEKNRGTEGTFTKKGNYICSDSITCNQNLTELEKLNDFIRVLSK